MATSEFLPFLETLAKRTPDFLRELHRRVPEADQIADVIDINPAAKANLEIADILGEWRRMQAINPIVMKHD
jgi:hypothetical protein